MNVAVASKENRLYFAPRARSASGQVQETSQLRETSVSTPKQIEDFVGRIKELLLQKTNGVFSRIVPQMYQEQYQESVPKNWLELVKDSGVVGTADLEKPVAFSSPLRPLSTGHRQSVTDTGPMHGPVPDKLPLPEGNHWDVFVTYAASTADVFFRLLDFTDQYEQLAEEMDKFYAEHSLPVSEAKEKWLYATNVEDNWMRVQVLEVQNGKAECFFLDHGDVDSVPVHKLQELDPKFLNLPFQIVHCQLDDLGDFADDEQANKLLNELFVGKCLIAEVAAREPVVTATFYDTTTDEDVNLNALLLKRLETPTLPGPEQITRVRLSHIDSEGNLYVQLQESGLSHVTRFMGVVGSHITQNNHQPASSLCESKLYACRLKDSVTFFRALLLSAVRTKDDKVLVRLVDIGQETLVYASNLYELEAFGESFVSFPHQAIICRLADIPPGLWTSKATSLLREMVPSDIDLLLKVVRPAKDGSEPLVAMFKRIEPNNELVSVNTSLAVALESSKGSGDFSPTSKVSASTLTIGPTGDGPSLSGMTSPLSELTALSLISSPELDEEGLQGKPLAAPELPEVGEYLDVNVTEAANPLNFTCQSWAHGAQLDALMSEMQSFYAAEGSSAFPEGLPEALLRKGRYYAGRHMDKSWYRVLVQQLFKLWELVFTQACLPDCSISIATKEVAVLECLTGLDQIARV
ncbi:hypothetical protein HPB49_004798 [Dermacentor silvarum]|uniref:Uncharacterized protein n=1 Tax=Dermacentor silvarum TaxID=543639 RepID=A0ACB8CVH3_DERSI|nr:hypothetical protein HPB49_004798 [Dermacentor silvarum]